MEFEKKLAVYVVCGIIIGLIGFLISKKRVNWFYATLQSIIYNIYKVDPHYVHLMFASSTCSISTSPQFM
jgi:hypothetical protein